MGKHSKPEPEGVDGTNIGGKKARRDNSPIGQPTDKGKHSDTNPDSNANKKS